jgi:hypothetical protein
MATSPVKKNRRWIWFFVVVFALAFLATAVLIVFNLAQQLRPEQLEAARKRWREQGPRDYTMTYTTRNNGDKDGDHFWVKVRGGRVVQSKYNGQPEPPERFPWRSMDALFDYIEKFMRIDEEPGRPKVYVRAIFDDQKAGSLLSYVHRVMGSGQRAEITVDTLTIDAP